MYTMKLTVLLLAGVISAAGVPRAQAASCPADLTGNGAVDVQDLLILLSSWGVCAASDDCPADLTGDGVVDVMDLLVLLTAWGTCPVPELLSIGPSPVGVFGQVLLKGANLCTDADAVVVFEPGVIATGVEFHSDDEVVVRVPIGAETGLVHLVTGVDAEALRELQTDLHLLDGTTHPDLDDLIKEIAAQLAAGTASNALALEIVHGHLLPLTDPNPIITDPDGFEYLRTRIVVRLAEWPLPAAVTSIPGFAEAQAVADDLGASIVGHLPSINGFVMEMKTSPQTFGELIAARDQAQAHLTVDMALLDLPAEPRQAVAATDTYARYREISPPFHGREDKWAYDRIQAPGAWNLITRFAQNTIQPVRIGVWDTGVDHTHPEFDGITWQINLDAQGNPVADSQGNFVVSYQDGDPHNREHGTRVASLMFAANGNIVHPQTGDPGMNGLVLSDTMSSAAGRDFVVFRNRGPVAPFPSAGLIQGTTRAFEIASHRNVRVRVLNVSFGTTQVLYAGSSPFAIQQRRNALNTLAAALTRQPLLLVVVAAGNDSDGIIPWNAPAPTPTLGYDIPGSLGTLPNVITVGAIDRNDQRANFSSFGPPVSLYAPGVEVFVAGGEPGGATTFTINNNRYARSNGTSFAAPQVAGTAALVRAVRPRLTAKAVKNLLIDTSFRVTTTYPAGQVVEIDALKAGYAVRQALLDAQLIQEDQPWTGVSKVVVGPRIDSAEHDPTYLFEVRRGLNGRATGFAWRLILPTDHYAPTLRHDGTTLAYYHSMEGPFGPTFTVREWSFAPATEAILEGPFAPSPVLGAGPVLTFNPRDELLWYQTTQTDPCTVVREILLRWGTGSSVVVNNAGSQNTCAYAPPDIPIDWWDHQFRRGTWRPNSRVFDLGYSLLHGTGSNVQPLCHVWWHDKDAASLASIPECPPGPNLLPGPHYVTWSQDGRARAGVDEPHGTDVATTIYYNQAGAPIAGHGGSASLGFPAQPATAIWPKWSPDGSEFIVGQWNDPSPSVVQFHTVRRDFRNVADRQRQLMLAPGASFVGPYVITWQW